MNSIYRIKSFLKKQSEEVKIMFFYRYISLIVTSFFYFVGDSHHNIQRRLFIIICLSISSIILSYLYIINEKNPSKIKLLVLIETLGNCSILIPSGGLNSPYVWYSINTILMTSMALKGKYSWINTFIYLSASTWISYLVTDFNNYSFIDLIEEESNIILSLILITSIIRLLSKYIKKMEIKGKKVKEANRKLKESMTHIMELYQAVHLFTTQNSKDSLIEIIINHTKKITKANTVIFYNISNEEDKLICKGSKLSNDIKEKLKIKISDLRNNILDSQITIELGIEGENFVLIALKSNYKTYGILGIKLNYKENIEQLQFLSELSSIVLEKFELEQVNEKLLITEEQNRIANEIHDSVLQRLFSISCGIFALIKKEKMTSDEMNNELNMIRSSINSTMKELRSTIYGLSWKKEGLDYFVDNISNYINEVKKLNNVDISFNIKGDHELLSSLQKKSVHRIICEGIGNAVNHGKANNIEVKLNIKKYITLLKIADNGKGFDLNKVRNKKDVGLGIKNIHYLTQLLNGEINFNTRNEKGTKIKITIPNNINNFKKEEVI
ncbi:MAG: hypothetical protein FH753_09925 [Firmicutes bacterium]|nr:hypothetical protein [Bacillota bacterium]